VGAGNVFLMSLLRSLEVLEKSILTCFSDSENATYNQTKMSVLIHLIQSNVVPFTIPLFSVPGKKK